jgi:CBS domain-containing protein
MLIETILKDKGGDVLTIPDTATLLDAAKMLDQKRIGAVVAVDGDGALIGVLSERDIVRRFARHAGATIDMTVADAMTRGVITASPSETIDTCLGRMTDRRIRHLPVIEKGELRGIISIGDLVKYKIDSVLAETEAMTAYIKSG